MNKRITVLTVAVIGLLLLFSCVPKHRIITAGNGILQDPAIVSGVLPNGFQYILMENATPKDRVDVHLNIFAGSLNETDEQQGVAHFLEHMLFNGSEHFKPGELIEYFQSIGMDFGADANAQTSFFNTVYDLSLPSGDQKQMAGAFIVIQDYAQGALLLETEIDKERGIILAEKRERDSVSYRSFEKSLKFELPGSLITQRFPIGKESVINTADHKLLKAYYDKWYRPDNMALIVVGDFDVKMVESLIVKTFSKLKPRVSFDSASFPTRWKKHKGIGTFYDYEPEDGSTHVAIETVSWKPFETETQDLLKTRILNYIANSILQNRLSRMVSKQTAPFSEASVYSGTFLHHVSLSAISAACDPGKWEQSLGQIENTLRQGLKFGFSQKELDRVKSDVVSSLEQQLDQADSKKTHDLAREILTAINQKELLLSPKQRKDILTPYIESISLQDVHQALKRSWSEDHRLILVSGNAEIKTNKPESSILDVYQKSAADRVNPYEGFESKKFPYLELPLSIAKIKTREDNSKNLGITTIELDNNIRMNFKKTDFQQNEFQFKVCFGPGKKAEPISKPGLALMTESVLKASGLGKIDEDQLEEALAGSKVGIDFSINEDYFSFSGSGDPREAELVFQLIYHYFNDAGYRAEVLDLAKTRYRQQYESLIRTPEGIMQIKGESFLAKNDTRFGLPRPDTIDQYNLSDIKNWINPFIQNSPVEISIVGDFDLEKMITLASKYMGEFRQREKFVREPVMLGKINFPEGETLELKMDTKIRTGVVHVAFLTDDFWKISQTRRFTVLSKIFSERLRIVIREELGETYSPYVYNDPSMIFDGYGILHVVVNVKPEHHQFVYNKIKEIVTSLTSEDILEKETESALKPILNHLEVFRKTNVYWLNSVMTNSSSYPQKLDWALNMIQDYTAITNVDLTALAKKFLKMEKSALIIIEPADNEN